MAFRSGKGTVREERWGSDGEIRRSRKLDPKVNRIHRKLRDVTDLLGTCIRYLLLHNKPFSNLAAKTTKITYFEALLGWVLLHPCWR